MELFQKHITSIFILIYLVYTFSQSSYEKVSDWSGSVKYIKEHFNNSPLKNYVPMLLVIVLVVETIASILMFIGIFQLATFGQKNIALVGIELSALTLIFLLIGQRLAKDYVGSTSITVYFILTVFGMYLLNS